MKPQGNAATMDRPRTLIAGALNESTGIYTLTLDGDEIVETDNEQIATTASRAKRAGQAFTVDLEPGTNGARARVLELRVVPPDATAEPAPTTPLARTSAPTAQALSKGQPIPAIPHGLIVQPEELARQMAAMQASYNVLSPAIAVSQMAPGYGANLAVVTIDASVTFDRDRKSGAGPDTYYSKFLFQGDEQKRALNKQGLLKISQAAGVQWDPHHCRRLDDGRERFYWRWQYYGGIRTHDGQWQPLTATRELDLRDGSGEAMQMASSNQLAQARARGNEICETKAMERAIRGLGIRQVYTVDELKKPFLIVRFSFTPDMSDPEIKKLVTQQAMSGIGALYTPPGGQALPGLPAPAPDSDPAETSASTAPVSAPPKKGNPFDEPASTEAPAHPTVAKVEKVRGTSAKNNRAWMRYDVTFSTGEIASTFSETLQQLVDEACAQKAPVKYSTTPNEGYNDKLETFAIVDTRQGALPMEPKL